MISVFLIGLVSAAVYQTPGFVPECDCDCPELTCEISSADVQIDSTNRKSLIAWTFAVIIIVIGLFLIIRREILMKKKKAKKEEEIPVMDEAQEEKLDELIEELGLDEVIDKTKEINKNEPKR